jgi:hypothetical protein
VADGGSSVGDGVGSSVVGGASPVGAGGGFSLAGGEFSAAGGGSSVTGGGSSVTGGDFSSAGADVVGSLVVGGGASVVVEGAEVPTVRGGGISPVLSEGSSEVGVAVLDLGRVAGEGATKLKLLLALATRAIPEPAPAKPSRTFRTLCCTVSLLPSSKVAACSSTCSTTPGRTRSIICRGMGLSESGANQVRNETTTAVVAITPAPANKDLRLLPPRRPRRKFRRAEAGAFIPRPLLLSRISFSIRNMLSYRRTRRIKTPPAISPAPKPSVSNETIPTGRRPRRTGRPAAHIRWSCSG